MGKLGFDRMKMYGMVDGSVLFICLMQCNIPCDSSTRGVYGFNMLTIDRYTDYFIISFFKILSTVDIFCDISFSIYVKFQQFHRIGHMNR
jgi:hypothetical protein